MAEPASFVSELEISKTSAFIKRKIILVQGDRVIIYGQEFKNGDPVVLIYSPCGDNSGHYECLVKITGQVRLPLLSSIARRSPVLPATPALAKRSRKVERSQILTSPYKKLLFDSTANANRKQHKTSGRKQTIQKTSQRGKGISTLSVASVKRKGNV